MHWCDVTLVEVSGSQLHQGISQHGVLDQEFSIAMFLADRSGLISACAVRSTMSCGPGINAKIKRVTGVLRCRALHSSGHIYDPTGIPKLALLWG